MFYKISDTLEPSTLEACMRSHKPYVAVMTSKEWTRTKDSFMMGIDLDIEYDRVHTTKAASVTTTSSTTASPTSGTSRRATMSSHLRLTRKAWSSSTTTGSWK